MPPVVRQKLVRAQEIIRNPKELLRLLTVAERRLERANAGRLTPLKRELQTLLRLMRAYGEGSYRQVSGKNLALAGLGLLYLVSPLDVLPDILPVGFADDAAVLGFVLRKIRTELAAFEAWERAQGSQAGWRKRV
ncbi:MAG: YkvA family protein [Actinomycetota bacterium]|jgi:uncharacterized membrane protein YkvA (DUF1232 family)